MSKRHIVRRNKVSKWFVITRTILYAWHTHVNACKDTDEDNHDATVLSRHNRARRRALSPAASRNSVLLSSQLSCLGTLSYGAAEFTEALFEILFAVRSIDLNDADGYGLASNDKAMHTCILPNRSTGFSFEPLTDTFSTRFGVLTLPLKILTSRALG